MIKRRRHAPKLEALEDRKLLSVLIAERENNDKGARANGVSFPADGAVQLQGISANRNDKDFFRFTAPTSGTLGVTVQSRNGVFAQLEVEGRNGVSLFETQPKNGRNEGTLAVTAGQTYVVRLRTPINARAAYTADLVLGGLPGGGATSSAPISVVGESRNDDLRNRANAVTLSPGNLVELRGIVTRRDRDFYSFTAPADGPLSVDSRTTNGVLAKVEIQDASGNQIFETEPNDGANVGTVTLAAGRTYFLRVRSAVDNAMSSYRIGLTFGSAGTGGGVGGGNGGGGNSPTGTIVESESNDEKGSADPFSLGTVGSARLQGISASKDDRDYFVFTPDRSGTVTVTLAATGGPVAEIEVEDASSVKRLELEDGRTTGSFAVVAGTRYFVRLRAPRDAVTPYDVSLTMA